MQNQEIHPIYSIDVINFPYRPEDANADGNVDLTGTYGGSDGGTYYVRQIGTTVWWLGLLRDRQPLPRGRNSPMIGVWLTEHVPGCSTQCWAFATVFKGTLRGSGDGATLEGDWIGVPQSSSPGDNGGHMRFSVTNHKTIVPLTPSGFPPKIEKMYEPPSTGKVGAP